MRGVQLGVRRGRGGAARAMCVNVGCALSKGQAALGRGSPLRCGCGGEDVEHHRPSLAPPRSEGRCLAQCAGTMHV